ncbi:MAG: Rrf2 family transcriptional regulator [Omnitrophica bacterium]|nr:Rrf2 family transcriptional regulator [Candidatus Omnitrophota bacterium]
MKLLTRNTDYAIRALCHIVKCKKKIVSVTDLVKTLKIPRPFLRKILQKLNKEGLLTSYKGMGGGFTLARPAGKILVTDLMKIFQGPIKLNDHIFKKGICPHIRTCALKLRLDVIEKSVISKLEAITIASLVKDVCKGL